MKKFLWLVLFLPVGAFAQFHITAWGGFSGYQGDLQSKRLALDQSNFAFGLGLKYDLTNQLALRTSINFGKVEAADAKNEAALQPRNLSFQSRITEGNLLLEYSIFDLTRSRVTPYVFAGLAVYHFDPFTYDTLGNKIYLKPLSTEGQGLTQYPDRKEYKLRQFAIPFGAGLRLRVADNLTIGYELGLRKLFTDYLDDVSTSYVDQATLLAERGPKAVEMAFRGGEPKNSTATYPADGIVRGGSKFKDWYYFHGISITVGLNKTSGINSRKRDIGCPKVL